VKEREESMGRTTRKEEQIKWHRKSKRERERKIIREERKNLFL
jgi:hypothetical protein